jgi:hypothetical protein
MLDGSSPFPKSVGCIIGTNVEQPEKNTPFRIIVAVISMMEVDRCTMAEPILSTPADHAFLTLDGKKRIEPFHPRIRFQSLYRRR